jgi:hypothetical protein
MNTHVIFVYCTVDEMILGSARLRLGEQGAWTKNIESSFSAADSADWLPRKS